MADQSVGIDTLTRGIENLNTLDIQIGGDDQATWEAPSGEQGISFNHAIRIMTELGIGFTAFETKTKMLTDGASLADGKYAVVTNDVPANIGVYLKKTGSWTLVPWNSFAKLDGIMINSGKQYPMLSKTRDGINSVANVMHGFILDVRVVNARPNCYYKISLYYNGSTANPDGWIVEEITSASYGTAAEVTARIITYTHPQPQIIRGQGVKQYVLTNPGVTNGTDKDYIDPHFILTVDTDEYYLNANAKLDAFYSKDTNGYSYIIDPLKYEYQTVKQIQAKDNLLFYKVSNKFLFYRQRSATKDIGVTFKDNGFNLLPNFRGLDYYNHTAPTGYNYLMGGNTDWLPPLIVKALSNVDTGSQIYTGGNHGSTGSDGGSKTAINRVYDIYIDGVLCDKTTTYQGNAESISVVIVNDLMAYNTISKNRYVIRQVFNVKITSSGVLVDCQCIALEDIVVEKDNGCQVITAFFASDPTSTQIMLNAQLKTRSTYNNDADSGTKQSHPNAWLVNFNSDKLSLTTWMDREYGLGDGSQVSSSLPMIRNGGGSNNKTYHAVISGGSGLALSAGQSYKWRGGYSFDDGKSISSFKDITLDLLRENGRQKVIVMSGDNYLAG